MKERGRSEIRWEQATVLPDGTICERGAMKLEVRHHIALESPQHEYDGPGETTVTYPGGLMPGQQRRWCIVHLGRL